MAAVSITLMSLLLKLPYNSLFLLFVRPYTMQGVKDKEGQMDPMIILIKESRKLKVTLKDLSEFEVW